MDNFILLILYCLFLWFTEILILDTKNSLLFITVTFTSVSSVSFHLKSHLKKNLGGGQLSDWSSCLHMSLDLQKNLGLTTWRGWQ